MTIIAHLSDTHLNGSERNANRTRRALAYLADLPVSPDVVLVTGDIVDTGAASDYDTMREIVESLRFRCPVLFCPGNHDARDPFHANLLLTAGDGPINQLCRLPEVTIALCDSLIPGESAGRLSEQTLSWLDGVLAAESGRPVFVALHHPPVPVGVSRVDDIRLRNADRLSEVLQAHHPTVGILCGHAHTGAAASFAGIPVLVAPGVVSTLRLPWEAEGDSMNLDAPVAIAFHLYQDDRLTTHFRFVVN